MAPLSGIRILDLSVALTGPLAVGMLADQGAEVIKIERPPFGDQARYIGPGVGGISAMFQVANRAKRAALLDLTDTAMRDFVLALASEADVFVHNYRPGVVERLGLDESAVRAASPDIVYVAISGFGQTGPYSHRPVYDTVVQAQGGLAASQGSSAEGAKPVFLRQLAADKITAYTAAQAVTAALLARERGGGPQSVELSMFDACISFLYVDGAGHQVMLDAPRTGHTSPAAEVTPMELADGWVVTTPVGDAEYHGMAAAFGVDSSDPRLATLADRFANREPGAEVQRAIRAAAVSVPLSEAIERLTTAGVPYGVVLSVDEVPDDPQAIWNGSFVAHDHPVAGRVRQPSPPNRFGGVVTDVGGWSAPTLGQDTDDILANGWRKEPA